MCQWRVSAEASRQNADGSQVRSQEGHGIRQQGTLAGANTLVAACAVACALLVFCARGTTMLRARLQGLHARNFRSSSSRVCFVAVFNGGQHSPGSAHVQRVLLCILSTGMAQRSEFVSMAARSDLALAFGFRVCAQCRRWCCVHRAHRLAFFGPIRASGTNFRPALSSFARREGRSGGDPSMDGACSCLDATVCGLLCWPRDFWCAVAACSAPRRGCALTRRLRALWRAWHCYMLCGAASEP